MTKKRRGKSASGPLIKSIGNAAPQDVKRKTIITGLLLSIVPVLMGILFYNIWQFFWMAMLWCVPLFYIRKLTLARKKMVFLIIPYLFILPLAGTLFFQLDLPWVPGTGSALDEAHAANVWVSIIFYLFFTFMAMLYSGVIAFFYVKDK